MVKRVCSFVLLVDVALAARVVRNQNEEEWSWPWSNKAKNVACPVMGALINKGMLNTDSQGRATQEETLKALMWTGNTVEMAGFQAKGIAAFKKSDEHQEYRERNGTYSPSDLVLNYNLWNPLAACEGHSEKVLDGLPCNANIGFQQHGFSTTLRDPTDGSSASSRWNKWMGHPGVLTNIPGVWEKVMTIEGLGALLKEARLHGSKHGEFGLTADNHYSGSNQAYYHPSASAAQQYVPASQWQALGAWAAFWALFAREKNGVHYMPESDLKRFFYDAKFPTDFSPKPWGFKETMKVVRELKGTGAGEEWTAIISGILAKVGENAPDKYYAGGMLQALESVGARADDKFKRYSR